MLSWRPLGLDVGDGGGTGAGPDGVLGVVDHVQVDAEVGLEGGHEGVDGAIALADDGAVLPVHPELGRDLGA